MSSLKTNVCVINASKSPHLFGPLFCLISCWFSWCKILPNDKKSNSMVKSKDTFGFRLSIISFTSKQCNQLKVINNNSSEVARRKWKWKHRIASILKIGSILLTTSKREERNKERTNKKKNWLASSWQQRTTLFRLRRNQWTKWNHMHINCKKKPNA